MSWPKGFALESSILFQIEITANRISNGQAFSEEDAAWIESCIPTLNGIQIAVSWWGYPSESEITFLTISLQLGVILTI